MSSCQVKNTRIVAQERAMVLDIAVDTFPLACTIMGEVASLPENQPSSIAGLISEARQHLSEELRAQAEELQKVEQDLQALRSRHQRLLESIERQLDTLQKSAPTRP